MSLSWKGFTLDDWIEELDESTTVTRRDTKKVLRQGAKAIMAASQQMCPIDEGNLEKAHSIEDIRLAQDNMVLEIGVGGVVDGVNVDDYALIQHETLLPYGSGPNHLGPKSRQKDAHNPSDRRVGGKFLDRAVDALEDEIAERLGETLPGDKV